MRKTLMVFGLVLGQCLMLSAQYVIKSESELAELKKLPLEKVYVHSNAPLLFPGEYLYYSVYCMNAMTGKLDNISRMAYVELVGKDLKPIFRQKVRLEGGRGQGDFFIPVSVPSGNYKLIGYTQWMKNAGPDQLFQDEISIINPYRVDQEAILGTYQAPDKDSLRSTISKNAQFPRKDATIKGDGSIVLTTDRTTYGKRDSVSLSARNYKGPLGYGYYSVSVRRKEALTDRTSLNAVDFSAHYLKVDKTIPKTVNDSIYLPEQRGELFFGTVLNKENAPVVGETVVISVPGEDFQLKSAITDEQGNFYTYVSKEYEAPVLLAQVVDAGSKQYKVRLKKQSDLDYQGMEFGSFQITPTDEKHILERSIHNQIENGYYSAKPDSILSIDQKDPFDGGTPEVVVLDEFTRFPTLRETLVEVVPNVWVKKLENGRNSFWVREELETYENDYESDPPLVLVDGVFVPNHNELLEYNARLIEKISVLRDPLVLGSKKYLGMVVIETINGDYLETLSSSNIGIHNLVLPAAEKNYFRQLYAPETAEEMDRIPDFRYQLLWQPQMVFDEDRNEVVFEFYTSDVPGDYEIVLEGFTTYGKPISLKKTFKVE